MKGAKRLILLLGVVIVIAGGTFAFKEYNEKDTEEVIPHVVVERGNIVDKALAVGTIEPRVEVSVKSQFSGVARRQFADVGDFVKAGDPLLEIKPTPTPRELVDAERMIQLRQIEVDNLKAEYERQQQLHEKQLVADQDFERTRRGYEEAKLQVQMAREQLELLREGRVATESGSFETVVRAPVSGFILDKMVEIGDNVVPLTSYQEGTVLMTMADMNDLIFRGTVDEIDVGRLKEGMNALIKVGALPNAEVKGLLARIWLKAEKEDNSTVFPVELEIASATEQALKSPEGNPVNVVLRAGYSANAEIIIEQRENVLLIPERVIEFSGDTARVNILLADNSLEERIIQTGLSDAIQIEVLSGVEEGQKIREKPPKVIE
ncbi:MAG: efflux RND transporter periplasmic adaptor subunit [Rhodothermales bacterium]